jgi:[ribosomal protein S5]-alanine N-acetyltransferase
MTEAGLNRALSGQRLRLEPLTAQHAGDLFEGLSDMRLYTFMPDEPPKSVAALEARYAKIEARRSPDGKQQWLNWAAFDTERNAAIGRFEATVLEDGVAHLAYIVFPQYWRRGYGGEGVTLVRDHLLTFPWIRSLLVEITPNNLPSRRLIEALNFVVKNEPIERLTDPEGTDVVYEFRRPD